MAVAAPALAPSNINRQRPAPLPIVVLAPGLPPLSPALSVPIVTGPLRSMVMFPGKPTLMSAVSPGALGGAASQLAASSQL